MSKRLRMALMALFLIICLFLGGRYYLSQHNKGEYLKISGNIEATTVNASFNIAGRIVSVVPQEGDYLKKGALIATLQEKDFQLTASEACAKLDAAEDKLQKLQNGSRPQDIEAAKDALKNAQATLENARQNYARMQQLASENAIAPKDLDQYEAAYKKASALYEQAKQNLDRIESGPRDEDIKAAAAEKEAAKQALEIAKTKLSYTRLLAPCSGFVLSKNLDAGEYAMPGSPVISMADLDDVWLRAYIPETDLGKIHLGEKIAVTTDSYPGKKYYGKITFISPQAEFTPKNIQTEKERIKLVYRIKISLANKAHELKPGMPADALIPCGKGEQNG